MGADVAIIGGTGIGARLAGLGGERIEIRTEFGAFAACETMLGDLPILAVPRHGEGHSIPPHLLNFRAMATGLASYGVRACLASAAVGALAPDWHPGTLAICTDFIDLTARNMTIFAQQVRHTPFEEPFPLARLLVEAANRRGVKVRNSAVYIGMNGPRYETPAEVRMLANLGGDIVGMTASSEAIVCAEAGVPYGCIAIVTNLGTGLSPEPTSHEGVARLVETRSDDLIAILSEAARLARND